MTISSEEHTIKRYDQELNRLRDLVQEMGGLVEDQISKAVEALEDEDLELAREVVARDRLVNELEMRVDHDVIELIALRQPMGSDLRMIMSLSRATGDLERIGDEAERIARMAIRIYDSDRPSPSGNLLRDIYSMAKLSSALLRGSLDALARMDLGKALGTARGDEELDKEFQAALRRLVTYMMEDPRNIGHSIDVTFILKSLERIGDHAANIAESVFYFIDGKDIRHTNRDDLERQLSG